jgi:hypothetical protein
MDTIYDWLRRRRDEVLHAPRIFLQFGENDFAVDLLEPHGFKLEVVIQLVEGP